jgi:hypothetical protein
MNDQTNQLQQELTAVLHKTDRHRKFLSISRILCYGMALLYFVWMFAVQGLLFSGHGSPFTHDYTQNPNPTFWEANKMLAFILPVILLVTIGGMGLSFFYKKFAAAEQKSVRHIVNKMFPDAKCYIEGSLLSMSLVRESNFFSGLTSADAEADPAYSFGAIVFDGDGQKLDVKDIVIRSQPGKLAQTQVGGIVTIFRALFGGLFAGRVENTMSSFRGLFAHAKLAKRISGSVVILPDHLEKRLDYLAKTLQSLKNINGNRLVQLEDVAFERLFVVYATDEVLARYILTPAMMLRMTELRNKYGRDVMLSFNEDKFFFAVAMPEGFLTLGKRSKNVVGDLYDNIVAVREILKNLKLDNAPEKEIVL